jgi:hypothetical protein
MWSLLEQAQSAVTQAAGAVSQAATQAAGQLSHALYDQDGGWAASVGRAGPQDRGREAIEGVLCPYLARWMSSERG